MGPLFTDTVTLYNHVRRGRTESWARTVISGVQICQTVKHDFADGKSVRTTETSVTIPIGADAGGKRYESPGGYSGEGWTLNPDDGADLLVEGRCEQEIDATHTVDELISRCGALTVRAAADNTRRPRLRHWKAVCS